jgi:hypothetical protein
VSARALFGWLGIVPVVAGAVFLLGWRSEEAGRGHTFEVADGT